jgi:acyl carrier protein
MLIAQRVDRVLRRQLGDGFSWSGETFLMSRPPLGLALDSLDIVQLIVGLENEFALDIPDDAFWTDMGPRVGRVRDLVSYIDQRLAQRPMMAFG